MKKYYVVMGTQSADPNSNRLFYTVDLGSGYPSTSRTNPERTYDLSQAVDWLQESGPGKYCNMHNPVVATVHYEPVDITQFLDAKKRVMGVLDGLTSEDAAI